MAKNVAATTTTTTTEEVFEVENRVYDIPLVMWGFEADGDKRPIMLSDRKVSTLVDLLMPELDQVPQNGFSLSEIRKRNRLVDVLSKAKPDETIKLDKEMYVELKSVCNNYRSKNRSKQMENFLSYIQEDLK